MAQDTLPAPPEAEVIRLARMAARMTPAQAAGKVRAAGGKISDTYWRDVERGHGGRRGQRVPARASEGVLAQMAHAVGVEPPQLTEAGREDAARVLEEILRRERQPVAARMAASPRLPAADAAARRAGIDPDNMNDPQIRAVCAEIDAAEKIHGEGATGSQVFHGTPASAFEAGVWDDRVLSERSKIVAIATLRAQRAQDEADRAGGSRSRIGLTSAVTTGGR